MLQKRQAPFKVFAIPNRAGTSSPGTSNTARVRAAAPGTRKGTCDQETPVASGAAQHMGNFHQRQSRRACRAGTARAEAEKPLTQVAAIPKWPQCPVRRGQRRRLRQKKKGNLVRHAQRRSRPVWRSSSNVLPLARWNHRHYWIRFCRHTAFTPSTHASICRATLCCRWFLVQARPGRLAQSHYHGRQAAEEHPA